MPIRFRCPSCQQKLGIASRKAGQVVSCPRCSYPATVPNDSVEPDDDETAAFAEEIAPPPPPPPKPPKKPIFERRDFEQVINGPVRPSGGGGKGAAVATKPEEPSAPPKPYSPPPLPAVRKTIMLPEPSGVPTSLAVGVAIAALAVGGGVGFMGGRMTAPARPGGAAADAPVPPAAKAKEPPAAAPAPETYKFSGTLKLQSGGKTKPDVGARVLLFPVKNTPLKPFLASGLKPGDENNADRSGLEGIERIRGAVATVDDQGKYEAAVERPGGYWVLAISSGAARPKDRPLGGEDRSVLDKYVSNLDALVGDRQFYVILRTAKDEPGGKRIDGYNATFIEE